MAVGFIKRGKEGLEALQREEAAAEQREKERSVKRFWVEKGAETKVTFLDGDVEDGVLDPATYNEHRLKLNGHWRNFFVCLGKAHCPICEQGDYYSQVFLFTVLDHTKYTDRNGKRHQHERRLFVAKRDTYKRLQKIALKHGGLTGVTVDISRHDTGRSPEVGNELDYSSSRKLTPAFAAKLKIDESELEPYDYEEVIVYRTEEDLRELGFGLADGEDDEDVIGHHDTRKLSKRKTSKKRKQEEDEDEDALAWEDEEEEEEAPVVKKKKNKVAKKKAKPEPVEDEDEDDTIVFDDEEESEDEDDLGL